jgi:phosphatidate cytidylyltransferase
MKRVLTAGVMVPMTVYVVLWANVWVFLAVLFAAAFVCYSEYDAMAAAYGFGAPGLLGAAAGFVLFAWRGDAWLYLVLLALFTLVLAMHTDDLSKALPRAGLLLTGVVYIFGCWKCAILLRQINPHWLMYALLVNWSGDIGAYYIGRHFGRHKLAPRVSPNKSWEGTAASVAASVLIAGAYLVYFIPDFGIGRTLALTIVANAAGQFGDLAESTMKRGVGVKDSGTLLPGHGGFLDRVDSTLFTLPVVYAWLSLT